MKCHEGKKILNFFRIRDIPKFLNNYYEGVEHRKFKTPSFCIFEKHKIKCFSTYGRLFSENDFPRQNFFINRKLAVYPTYDLNRILNLFRNFGFKLSVRLAREGFNSVPADIITMGEFNTFQLLRTKNFEINCTHSTQMFQEFVIDQYKKLIDKHFFYHRQRTVYDKTKVLAGLVILILVGKVY